MDEVDGAWEARGFPDLGDRMGREDLTLLTNMHVKSGNIYQVTDWVEKPYLYQAEKRLQFTEL